MDVKSKDAGWMMQVLHSPVRSPQAINYPPITRRFKACGRILLGNASLMVVETQHAASLRAGHIVGSKIHPRHMRLGPEVGLPDSTSKKEGIDKHLQDKLAFLRRAFALNMMRDCHSGCSRRFFSISLNVGAKEAMTGEGSSGCQALIA